MSTLNNAHVDVYMYIVINSETSNKCNRSELEIKRRIITNTVRDVYTSTVIMDVILNSELYTRN